MNIHGDTWAMRLGFYQTKSSFSNLHDQAVSDISAKYAPGELFNRVQAGCRTSVGLWFQLAAMLSGSITLVLLFSISFSSSGSIFVLFLCIPLVVILRIWFENKSLNRLARMRQTADNTRVQVLSETIRYGQFFHQYNACDWAMERYTTKRDKVLSVERKQVLIKSFFTGINDCCAVVFRSVLALLSAEPVVAWGSIGAAFISLDGLQSAAASLRDTASRLLGLESHVDIPVGQLSQGQAQRVNIARTLLHENTALAIYDEPASSLDNEMALVTITEMLDTDRTVVYATHDIAMARYARRILVLADGKIREDIRVDGGLAPSVLANIGSML